MIFSILGKFMVVCHLVFSVVALTVAVSALASRTVVWADVSR